MVVFLGDKIRVLPSGTESKISRIVTYDGDLELRVQGVLSQLPWKMRSIFHEAI